MAAPTLATNASAGVVLGGSGPRHRHARRRPQPQRPDHLQALRPGRRRLLGNACLHRHQDRVKGNGGYDSSDFTPSARSAPTAGQLITPATPTTTQPQSPCNAGSESVTVSKATPDISTTSSGTVVIGSRIARPGDDRRRLPRERKAGLPRLRAEGCGLLEATAAGRPLLRPSATEAMPPSASCPRKPGTYRWVATYAGDPRQPQGGR